MDLNLKGKRALISGASRGIGKAIATALAREGCRIFLNGRDKETLEAAAREVGTSQFLSADVTKGEDCRLLVKAVLKEWDGLDILVCNVGSGRSVPPGEESAEEWNRSLQVNLFATTNLVEAATPALSQNEGAILCLSSICGEESLGAPVTYSSAKAALNAFVRGISRPLAKKKVRINALAPGNILFSGSVWERKLKENRAEVEALLTREVPLGRLGTAEEVADFAAFLVSPRSSFATGTLFTLDGGQLRGNG